jgi:hypothetical protein
LLRLEITGSGGWDKGSLADLTPLSGIPLMHLEISGNAKVDSLSALRGMPLKKLSLNGVSVKDLTPLQGMSLEWLTMSRGYLGSDLTPLEGMPLKTLGVGSSKVSDLRPLKGMLLTFLDCSDTQVSDLAPLRGMRLKYLWINNTHVSDLQPLVGMPLAGLGIKGTSVTDLSPLKNLPLFQISGDFQEARDAKNLLAIKSLTYIDSVPSWRFWEHERHKNKVPAFLRGEYKPADNTERLVFAEVAYMNGKMALSTRLYAEALESDPKLGDDRQIKHPYNAACSAALAAAGQGQDEPPLDGAAKARLRRQALAWLKSELLTWKRVFRIIEPGNQERVTKQMTHWKQDPELTSIRDEKELAKLPEDERKDWQSLWADVEALLKATGS